MPGVRDIYFWHRNAWRSLLGEDVVPPPPRVATPPSVFAVSAFKHGANGTHFQVSWPAGHQPGDVSIIFAESANDVLTLFLAGGFVQGSPSPTGTGTVGGTASTALTWWWKRATTNAEPPVSVYASGAADHLTYYMVTLRGCDETVTAGLDVTPVVNTAAASTTVTFPAVTTVTDQSLILRVVTNPVDTTTAQFSAPSVGTIIANGNHADGNGGGIAIVSEVKATLGSTGTPTGTLAASVVQARGTFAFRPSPATGGGGGGGTGIPLAIYNLYRTNTEIETVGTASFDASYDSCNTSNIIARIDAAFAQGIRLVLMMTGGSHSLNYAPGVPNIFDLNVWKARMDAYDTTAIKAAVAAGVTNGTILGCDVMDEPQHYSWNNGVSDGTVTSKALIDTMCNYVRAIFPTIPVGVTVKPEWKTSTTFSAVDFVVYQYSLWAKGPITAWKNMGLAQAALDHVKIVEGLNPVNGGTLQNTNMTATQIEDWGTELIQASSTYVVALEMWRHDVNLFGRSDVQAACANLHTIAATVSSPATWFRIP